jgi:Rieske Fe-S protein
MSSADSDAPADCDSCPLGPDRGRRDFIRDAVIAATLAVGALGTWPRRASALPVLFATGTGGRTDKAYPIPAADGVMIDKAESVIVARFENKVFAFGLACPHQNTALRWVASAGRFQCPKHESRYRPDGVFIEGRATRGLDRFAVGHDGDRLIVNLDALYEEDKQIAEWKAAYVQL